MGFKSEKSAMVAKVREVGSVRQLGSRATIRSATRHDASYDAVDVVSDRLTLGDDALYARWIWHRGIGGAEHWNLAENIASC